MYARPLFVVVGISGPVWAVLTAFPPVLSPSPWHPPTLRIYAGGMNEAARPAPSEPAPLVSTLPQAAVAPQLSVIVPTFNERDNVTTLYKRLEAALAGAAWEVIFV